MTTYLFVAMDVNRNDEIISATQIVQTLLDNGFWAFSDAAPVKERLEQGDKLLIYVGGADRHYFAAAATVSDGLTEASGEEQGVLKELGLSFMKQTVALKNAVIFPSPVKIQPLLDDLDFIKDSRNYGLFLRLPVREIPESDYQKIVSQAKR